MDVDPSKNAVAEQESSPAIFKLNASCNEHLFGFLSLHDLHSLNQTCKRMHQLTGLYFQENFKSYKLHCQNQTICLLNGFAPFIRSIRFYGNNVDDDYTFIATSCDSLRKISFQSVELTETKINNIKVRLNQIETIIFSKSLLPIDLYESFLKFCSNLKTLCFDGIESNEWMRHKYPTLEQLVIYNHPDGNLGQNFGKFLQKNVHLQSFKTDHPILLKNSDAIIDSGIELDVLNVWYSIAERPKDFDNTCTLLKQLYDNGSYKRLEFIVSSPPNVISQAQIDQIGALGGLEKFFGHFDGNIVLPKIIGLKELCIHNKHLVNINAEALTDAFPNLSHVYLEAATEAQLIPFLRRLPALKELFNKAHKFQVNLSKLNEEREKLTGAGKVTLYLEEEVYLETKRTTKTGYANRNSIEIKRIAASNISSVFYQKTR